MKNNKGFTLVEMLAVVTILAILLSLATFTFSKYLVQSKNKTFELAVNTFEDTVASSLDDCASGRESDFCNTYSIPEIGSPITIQLSELVNNYYVEPIKSPYKANEICTGYIVVNRESVSVNHKGRSFGDDNSNIYLKYKTCLICGDKQSQGCYD